MKVGKEISTTTGPLGTIIYATNMLPKILMPGENIKEAVAEYEELRKQEAIKNGELEPYRPDGGRDGSGMMM